MILRRLIDNFRGNKSQKRGKAKVRVAQESVATEKVATESARHVRKKKVAGRELLHWTADLSVGHPLLDADHKHLCDLLNYLFDCWHAGAPVENLKEVFDELEHDLITHFRNEEEVLNLAQYPELARHMAEHEELEQEMRIMRQEIEASLMLAPNRNVTKPILDFLRRVILKHILSSDMDYRAHLLKK